MAPVETPPEHVGDPLRGKPPRGPGRWLEVVLLDTFITLSMYVLSIGPLYWKWYSARYVDGPPALAAFYEPLFLTAQFVPPFGAWLDWYISWWIL